MVSTKLLPTICILYGFCEGPHTGRQLCRCLRKSGFRITEDATHADIIITHSGGFYMLPRLHHARLIVIIGCAYWPGKNRIIALYQKVLNEFNSKYCKINLRQMAIKLIWNGIYFWNMRNNLQMVRGLHHIPNHSEKGNILLIRNKEDTVCIPDIKQLPKLSYHQSFLSLPGPHDDCWAHPDLYTAIIKEYYGKYLLV